MRFAGRLVGVIMLVIPVVLVVWVSTSEMEHTGPDPAGVAVPGWRYTWGDEFDGPAGGPPGWRYTWGDEFDGPAGGPPGGGWMRQVGGDGWGAQEQQYTTLEASNASLDGHGVLAITTRREGGLTCWYGPCEYTTARLVSQYSFSQRHGRFEARLKLPAGAGVQPQFLSLGETKDCSGHPDCGEIAVMRHSGAEPGTVRVSVRGPGLSAPHGWVRPERSVTDEFHIYAAEWDPGRVTWFLDGKPFHTVEVDERVEALDRAYHVLLTAAVSGNGATTPISPGRC